jgi:phytoene synthase
VRDPATALYAFCRVADDAIDHSGGRQAALDRLRERLARAYEGRPLPIPADRALAVVLARFAIPAALPEALLDGFAWDAAGRRYQTYAELQDYAARVASTVGAMMAAIMGVRDAAVLARACELGLAMQLTNIARDVGEDARAGRLYLPLEWLAEEGVDVEAFLANPSWNRGVARTTHRLLAHADRLYAQATTGIAHLPAICRPAIHAARLLYAAIGNAARRPGFNFIARRAVVRPAAKLRLVGSALTASLAPTEPLPRDMPASVRALVEAANLPMGQLRCSRRPWRHIEDRVVWTLDLFATLEARQRIGTAP